MKNRNTQRTDYRQFRSKIFFRMSLIVFASICTPMFIYFIFRGKIGNWMVDLIQSIFFLGSSDAQEIYQSVIRNNTDFIIIIIMGICFIVFFYILVQRLTSYFDEINAGVDQLIDGKDKEIALSHEMNFMEKKLTILKQTLKERERTAKQAEQKKNDLVMYLAHDIRTPLTSVIGYLSLLDEAPDMPMEQKAKYVHITLTKAYRLEQLINEFFEITRFNSQTISLHKENTDLYYMLVQMVDEAYPQLSAQGQSVQIHSPENMIVYCDADKLARVFNNILKNAIAYSKNNSNIDITAKFQDGKAIIAFQNMGTIPKEKLLTIFEKFYRLDDSRTTSAGGFGLGLAIAKEIIILHEGSIRAESDNQHITFTVELPIPQETDAI